MDLRGRLARWRKPLDVGKLNAYIERYFTFATDDWDDLDSTGSLWDELYPLLNTILCPGRGCYIYQEYDGYDWLVVDHSQRRLLFHIYLHDESEDAR